MLWVLGGTELRNSCSPFFFGHSGGECVFISGEVIITAGETISAATVGGALTINAGEGSSTYTGDGGDMNVYGAAAQGGNKTDNGGSIKMEGVSRKGTTAAPARAAARAARWGRP